ncbi:alpha/beta hydrolase [Martelella mediterranea]|uniref:Putative membrane protein n=1 Tax=Martelella mediterranea TaxID=293089 RepID=A0A4R3NVL1_9HYPH|nr:alpha/beta-hydrolase family protein [Martelella mediterranea]TCT40905.1 putative membrane protein [Martelella mediterranea]
MSEPRRSKRYRFSFFAFSLGLVFFAASLTPSLIPRGWVLQGILAGLVMALGYMIGRFLVSLWRGIEIPEPEGRVAIWVHGIIVAAALGLLVFCLYMATDWQNSVRIRVGMEPLDGSSSFGILGLGLAVFLVLFAIGLGFQRIFDMLRRRLYRYIAPRAANVLGLAVVLSVVFLASRDWVLPNIVVFLDDSYETAQDLFDTAPPAPTDPLIPGSAQSLVSWEAMGQPGRNFVTGADTAADIEAFSGRPAKRPIRVYVGRAQDDDPKERARLALEELKRLNAFDRKVLLVASPTGTGWLDPGAHETLEFIENGDIATVAVQYSYLQSPLALVIETATGLDQATATMQTIYDYWLTLPEDDRPQLFMHGISLGAWSSMYSFNVFQMMNQPVAGALWAGPPFPSEIWRQTVAARNEGTPYVLPKVGNNEVVRFSSQYRTPESEGNAWGRIRINFLQYASDPIVFFEPGAFWFEPQWMKEKPAPDVSPKLRFMPVVTQFQLALDMALAKALPAGYGHNYVARDYIDAWVAVTNPENWTPEMTERLKSICNLGKDMGCEIP